MTTLLTLILSCKVAHAQLKREKWTIGFKSKICHFLFYAVKQTMEGSVIVWVLVLSQFEFLIFVTIFAFEFEKMLFELLSFVTIQGLAFCPNFIGVLLVFEFLRFFSSQIRFVTFVTILWENKNHEKKIVKRVMGINVFLWNFFWWQLFFGKFFLLEFLVWENSFWVKQVFWWKKCCFSDFFGVILFVKKV